MRHKSLHITRPWAGISCAPSPKSQSHIIHIPYPSPIPFQNPNPISQSLSQNQSHSLSKIPAERTDIRRMSAGFLPNFRLMSAGCPPDARRMSVGFLLMSACCPPDVLWDLGLGLGMGYGNGIWDCERKELQLWSILFLYYKKRKIKVLLFYCSIIIKRSERF